MFLSINIYIYIDLDLDLDLCMPFRKALRTHDFSGFWMQKPKTIQHGQNAKGPKF